jgi:hypothetical protein
VVLIGGIVAAVVVVGIVAGVALRRRTHDDVHSVAHYHRQLHTLQELRAHPVAGAEDAAGGNGEASYPASAFRVSSSSAVRLTEPGGAIVPPVPPPPLPDEGTPATLDDDTPPEGVSESDTGADVDTAITSNGHPEPAPLSYMTGVDDPAMHSINRRPRRLAGPLAAIAAVVVLVVVLIVTGLHSNNPSHRGSHGNGTTVTTSHAGTHAGTHTGSHTGTHTGTHQATTTTTAAPAVSAPANASTHAATYQVADTSYSLALAAKTGECWVSATETSTGKVLYEGLLTSGQSQTVAATGPLSVIAGSPSAFSATVNGAPVLLPPGAQAPFTLTLQPPGGTGNTGASGPAAGAPGTTPG